MGWEWLRALRVPEVSPAPELSCHRVPLTGEARLPHQFLFGENLHCLQEGRSGEIWGKNCAGVTRGDLSCPCPCCVLQERVPLT